MVLLSADKDAEIIEAFNSTSRYVDDLLNVDNTYRCVSLILYMCNIVISRYIPPSVLPLLLHGT